MSDTPSLAIDSATTALLVIDLQNDFCHPDGFFARAGHDVGPCRDAATRVGPVIDAARAAGMPVVFTQSINPDPPVHRLLPRRFRAKRDDPSFEQGVGGTEAFAPGSWGTELVSELAPAPGDLVVPKTRYDAFHGTRLEDELRARGTDTVAIAGVITHACVETTARVAYCRGFDVLVLSDCVGAFAAERHLHDSSLEVLDLLFGVVAPSEALNA